MSSASAVVNVDNISTTGGAGVNRIDAGLGIDVNSPTGDVNISIDRNTTQFKIYGGFFSFNDDAVNDIHVNWGIGAGQVSAVDVPIEDENGYYLGAELEAALKELGNIREFFNGTFDETFNAVVTSDGATVTMSLEQSGGGDLTMNFSDGKTTFPSTPAATIALTAGSDTSPTENFIYIPKSTKVLTKSTSGWATEEHIKIAYFFVPSAGFVQTSGTYVNQNWNDHKEGTDNQGHMSHSSERSRRLGAQYFSGVDGDGTTSGYITINANAGVDDNVFILSTSGIIYQLHDHNVPSFDSSGADMFLIPNDSVAPYDDVQDLANKNLDSTGSTMSQYRNYVLWGVVNKSGEFSAFMVNLPNGSYNTEMDATTDVDGFDVFTIPSQFNRESSTGFLIARITMRRIAAGGGTWSVIQTTDLRGITPAQATGGGVGGTATSFPDNIFRIFDEADVTKLLAFDVGVNLDTTTTRTLNIPNANGTICLTSQSNGGLTLLDVNVHSSLGDSNITTAFNYINGLTSNGALQDYNITKEGGQFDVNWTSGAYSIGGYICNSVAGSSTLTAETDYWLYGTITGCPNLTLDTSAPTVSHALIAKIHTTDNNVFKFENPQVKKEVLDLYNSLDDMHDLLVVSGLLVEEDTEITLVNDFTVSTGTYYRKHHILETLGSTFTSSGASHDENKLITNFHSGGTWTTDSNSGVVFSYWDNGTDLEEMTANKWYAGFIYIQDDNSIGYVFPQTEHDDQRDALDEVPTFPPNFNNVTIFISKIVLRGSATNFSANRGFFVDIRPIHGVSETALGWAFQNVWTQFVSNSGTTTTDSPDDVLTIIGSDDITTSISGDTLTIDYNGVGDQNLVFNVADTHLIGLNNGIIIDRDGTIDGTFPNEGQGIARAWDTSLNPDMAEMTYTLDVNNVEGGDVMCAQQNQGSVTIRKCSVPYAVNSIGVISFEAGYTTNTSCSEMSRNSDGSPQYDGDGFIMWESRGCANYKPLAVSGRVLTKVKCDTEINAGDLIVSSSRSGVGQSYKTISAPTIGQVWDYLGSVLGKALEDCTDNSPDNTHYIWVQIGGTAN